MFPVAWLPRGPWGPLDPRAERMHHSHGPRASRAQPKTQELLQSAFRVGRGQGETSSSTARTGTRDVMAALALLSTTFFYYKARGFPSHNTICAIVWSKRLGAHVSPASADR